MLQLKKVLSEKIPAHRERVTSIAKQHGDKKVGEVNASQLIGGMRGIKCLLCDTSYLDPQEGIRFRGYTIPETRKKLPTDDQTNEPYPIGIWYLLLTGDIPSREAVEELNNEIRKRQQLPQYVIDVLRALPADAHPMMMFSSAILSMQPVQCRHDEGPLLGSHLRGLPHPPGPSAHDRRLHLPPQVQR